MLEPQFGLDQRDNASRCFSVDVFMEERRRHVPTLGVVVCATKR